jgi:hypothetical protein
VGVTAGDEVVCPAELDNTVFHIGDDLVTDISAGTESDGLRRVGQKPDMSKTADLVGRGGR